jgi:hypothetical protein
MGPRLQRFQDENSQILWHATPLHFDGRGGFMTDDQRKHLEFIQNIIGRMAQCSFLIKGWSVTLVAALFALAAKDADGRYAFIPYIPVFAFWVLDGYFLYQERLYRGLYEDAVAGKVNVFALDASKYEAGKRTWLSSICSTTLLWFHGVLFVTVLIVMFILVKKWFV